VTSRSERRHAGLRAGPGTDAGFAVSGLPARWPGWLAGACTTSGPGSLQAIVAQECQRPAAPAHLAHGDLDVTHIWPGRHGRSAGIIDFGEMRGADLFSGAGHFLLHDRQARPQPRFEDFLAGSAEAGLLPAGHRDQIRRPAVLSGVRQLSRWPGPRRNWPASRPARSRITRLRGLLAAGSR
jgi:hypothetical protein